MERLEGRKKAMQAYALAAAGDATLEGVRLAKEFAAAMAAVGAIVRPSACMQHALQPPVAAAVLSSG